MLTPFSVFSVWYSLIDSCAPLNRAQWQIFYAPVSKGTEIRTSFYFCNYCSNGKAALRRERVQFFLKLWCYKENGGAGWSKLLGIRCTQEQQNVSELRGARRDIEDFMCKMSSVPRNCYFHYTSMRFIRAICILSAMWNVLSWSQRTKLIVSFHFSAR